MVVTPNTLLRCFTRAVEGVGGSRNNAVGQKNNYENMKMDLWEEFLSKLIRKAKESREINQPNSSFHSVLQPHANPDEYLM